MKTQPADAPALILHLEDSDLDAELVRNQLDRCRLPLCLERVSDRRGFVARLQEQRYDLILSDYQVPTFSDLEALELARTHQPETPFIFVSGAIGEEIAVESLKQGAIDYVLKQRLNRLPAAIERALAEARERAERKRSQQALRDSEERLSEIFRSAPSFMAVLRGPEHVFELANDRFSDLVGARPLLGKPLLAALPELADQDHPALLDTVFRGGEVFTGRCLQIKVMKPGSATAEERYVDVVYQPLREGDGRVGGILVNGVDLTDRLRAEAAVRAGELRLRAVLDSVPQKVFTASAAGEINYCNPPWIEFTGLSFERIKGWGWTQCIHPEDVDGNMRVWHEAMASGGPFEYEHRFRRHDGEYRWHLSRARAIVDEQGQPTLWVGSTTDIHEIKTAQQALVRSAAAERRRSLQLTALGEVSQSVNALLSTEGIVQVLAEEARRILATQIAAAWFLPEPDAEPGASWISLPGQSGGFPPAAPDELSRQVCRGNKPLRLTAADVHAHPVWRPGVVTAPAGRGWLGVPIVGQSGDNLGLIQVADKLGGDFSAEDEALLAQLANIAAVGIENSRLYDSLREQDRRKDEFLATLAHELRNPLAPVRNGLQILKLADDPGLAERTRDMMERQIEHMAHLIDDLMDVSRITRGVVVLRKEAVELRRVIESALDACRPQIEAAGQTLAVALPDEAVRLQADPTRLAQMLSNLLNNASKYSPRGGPLEVSARLDGEAVAIRVRDDGIGIPKPMLSKVFDMFLQVSPSLDRAQGGLGIGLTIVDRLARMHGGSVTAESDGPGRGSSFTLTLPRAAAADALDAAAGADGPAALPERCRVLVVDDNRDGADSLATLIRMWGHDSCVAHAGQEAVAAAQAACPDIIFLDIGLPGMNGYEIARVLRADPRFDRTRLVALTGWGSEEDRRRSREAGFDDHLTKPVDHATVYSLVSGAGRRTPEAAALPLNAAGSRPACAK